MSKYSQQNQYELYNSLLDSLPDIIIIVGQDGEVEWVNQAWRNFALQNGANSQLISGVGCNYLAVCAKAEQEGDSIAGKALHGIENVLRGEIDKFSIEYPCHSGSEKHWYRMGVVRLASDEKKVLITHHNISEQASVEQELDEENSRFFTLFENSPVGFGIVDREGNLLISNDAFELMIFSSENTERTTNLFDALSTMDDPERLREKVQLFEVIAREEVRFVHNGGQIGVILISLIPINYDKQACLLAILEDVTDKVQKEEALQASEERFRLVVNSMVDIVFTLDKEGRHTGVFGQWLKDINLTEEFLLGRSALEIFGPEAGQIHHEANLRAIAGEDVVYEWSYQDNLGEHFIQTRLSPLRDLDQQIQGVVGVGRDITPQIKAERNALEYARRLESLNHITETLNQFHLAQPMYEWITTELAHLLQAEKVFIGVVNPENGMIEPQSPAFGIEDSLLSELLFNEIEVRSIWDFRSKGTLVANEFEQIPVGFRHEALQLGVKNALVSHYLMQDDPGGYIVVINKTSGFKPGDIQFLNIVTRQVGVVLTRLRLYSNQEAKLKELSVLHQVSLMGVSAKSEDELISKVTEIIGDALFPDNFGVLLVQENGQELKAHPSYRGASPMAMETSYRIGRGSISGIVAMDRNPLRIDDVSLSEDYYPANEDMHSELCVPISIGEELIGVLNAESSQTCAFTDEDEQLMMTVAGLLATGISKLRREQAERNERYKAETLAQRYDSLYQQAKRAADRQAALHRASQEVIAAGFDPEKVFESIHHAIKSVMPAEAFVITLMNDKKEYIEAVYAFDRGGRSNKVRIPIGGGFSGYVIEKGHSVLIADVMEQPGPFAGAVHFGSSESVRSVIASPIRRKGSVVGIISAQSYQPNVYTEEDIELLELFAANVSSLLENVALYNETKQRAKEMGAILDTTRDLAGIMDLDELLGQILQRATSLLNLERGGIYLYDEQQNNLVLVAEKGLGVQLGLRIEMGESMSGRVALSREPLAVSEYSNWEGRSAKYGGMHYTSSLDVPMLYAGELVGVLLVTEIAPKTHDFTEQEVELLKSFATQAAAAVQGARLFEQTQRRLRQLETIDQVSKIAREASEVAELLPTFLQEALNSFECEHGGIWMYDLSAGVLCPTVTQGWFTDLHEGPQPTYLGLAGWVFNNNQPLIISDFRTDERTWEVSRDQIPSGWGGVGMPIASAREVLGVIFLAFPTARSLNPDELTFLSALCEIAGNAIYRIQVDEQMKQRIDQLMSLRTIDNAINASLDLELTLNILLDQVVDQLDSDAADILLLEPGSTTFRVSAQRGFRHPAYSLMRIPLGYGLLPRCITDRQLKTVFNLEDINLDGVRDDLFRREGFVGYAAVPLVAKGQIVGILEVYYRDSRRIVMNEMDFLDTLAGQAAIAINNATLFDNLQRSSTQLYLAYDATLEGWARALELRDRETEGHSRRINDLTMRLALSAGISEEELVHIRRGALLHDIGKMGIPDQILNKEGPLSEEEWKIMREHPNFAYLLLKPIQYLERALDIPYCHHERWDGSGYPRGLKGEQIPIAARIFAIIDVYDALCSDRPYRKAWSEDETRAYIKQNAGILFDPHLVNLFLKILTETGNSV